MFGITIEDATALHTTKINIFMNDFSSNSTHYYFASVGRAPEAYGSRRVCVCTVCVTCVCVCGCLSVCLYVCMSFALVSLQQ